MTPTPPPKLREVPAGLTRQEYDRNILSIAYHCHCSVNDVFRAIDAGCVSLDSFKKWISENREVRT